MIKLEKCNTIQPSNFSKRVYSFVIQCMKFGTDKLNLFVFRVEKNKKSHWYIALLEYLWLTDYNFVVDVSLGRFEDNFQSFKRFQISSVMTLQMSNESDMSCEHAQEEMLSLAWSSRGQYRRVVNTNEPVIEILPNSWLGLKKKRKWQTKCNENWNRVRFILFSNAMESSTQQPSATCDCWFILVKFRYFRLANVSL